MHSTRKQMHPHRRQRPLLSEPAQIDNARLAPTSNIHPNSDVAAGTSVPTTEQHRSLPCNRPDQTLPDRHPSEPTAHVGELRDRLMSRDLEPSDIGIISRSPGAPSASPVISVTGSGGILRPLATLQGPLGNVDSISAHSANTTSPTKVKSRPKQSKSCTSTERPTTAAPMKRKKPTSLRRLDPKTQGGEQSPGSSTYQPQRG